MQILVWILVIGFFWCYTYRQEFIMQKELLISDIGICQKPILVHLYYLLFYIEPIVIRDNQLIFLQCRNNHEIHKLHFLKFYLYNPRRISRI